MEYLRGNNLKNKILGNLDKQSGVCCFMLIYNFLISVAGDKCHEDMTEKKGGECHKMNET